MTVGAWANAGLAASTAPAAVVDRLISVRREMCLSVIGDSGLWTRTLDSDFGLWRSWLLTWGLRLSTAFTLRCLTKVQGPESKASKAYRKLKNAILLPCDSASHS